MKTYTEAEIAAAVADYAAGHEVEIDDVDVCRQHEGDDGPIIGFRLSLDADGRSYGADERFGAWGK